MNYSDALYDLEVKYLTEVANLSGKMLGEPYKLRQHKDGIRLTWGLDKSSQGAYQVIFTLTDRDAVHATVVISPNYGINGLMKTVSAYAIDASYPARTFITELKKRGLIASKLKADLLKLGSTNTELQPHIRAILNHV